MGEANDDTLPGESANDDTIAASPSSEPGARTPMPRIRPSRPSLQPGTRDYPQLTVVDPAHYIIGRELARGGMGRIQIARDRRLGRDVAVKEVLVAAGSIARRFEREARITARLQHPSIISVHEAGTWPSGEPFYAMRLVTGRTLDEALAAAKTYDERLALLPHVLAIADAMAYAHAQKIIHRDLKPRNVVVGEFGETVVIDWGLAKELGVADETISISMPPQTAEPTESNAGETTLGEVLGTPSYMPPEQANGEPVDERADVYAIGSILYHVLAGRPPYVADSNAELIAALHAAPPRPLAKVAPQVAQELMAIVDRAMARDRDQRYPTALALAEDLRRFQTGQLVGAHRYSLRQLLRRWIRRHRTALAAVAAATLVAIAIGVVAVQRIVAAEGEAQDERVLAQARRAEAEDLLSFMIVDLQDKLEGAGNLAVLDSVARRALTYIEHHPDAATEREALLAAHVQILVGHIAQRRGDLKGALAAYTLAQTRHAKLSAEHPEVAKYRVAALEAERLRADTLEALGDGPAAAAIYREIEPLAEQNLAAHPDDSGSIHAVYYVHYRAGSAFQAHSEYAKALVEYRAALALAERRRSLDDRTASRREILGAHAVVGAILALQHDDAGALAEYRLALGIGEAGLALEPKSPRWLQDVALSHNEIGNTLKSQKDLAGALAEYRAGVDAARRAVAIDPSNTDMLLTQSDLEENVGVMLFEQKDYAAALVQFKTNDAISRELVQRDPSNTDWLRGRSISLNKLADLQLATKDPRGAIESYKVALEVREKLVAKDPANAKWRRDLFYSHFKLARAYDSLHDDKTVLAELRAAVAVADITFASHPKNETYADDAAETHEAIGEAIAKTDPAGAQLEYRRAAEIAHAMVALPKTDPAWAKTAAQYDAKLH